MSKGALFTVKVDAAIDRKRLANDAAARALTAFPPVRDLVTNIESGDALVEEVSRRALIASLAGYKEQVQTIHKELRGEMTAVKHQSPADVPAIRSIDIAQRESERLTDKPQNKDVK